MLANQSIIAVAITVMLWFTAAFSARCVKKSHLSQFRFATKTPYRANRHLNMTRISPAGCEATMTWMIYRHGTRFSSEKVIFMMNTELPTLRDDILENHKNGYGSLCEEDLAALKDWQAIPTDNTPKALAHEGEEEMIELAERYQARFPNLLSEDYDNDTVKFRYTATQRAAESARSFAVGLYGRSQSRRVWYPEPVKKDPLIRFYKNCPMWKTKVDKNPEAVRERKLFESQAEVEEAVFNVSKQLGFQTNLTFDTVELLYLACSFETSWSRFKESPWCAAFSDEALKVLEYREDMEYYWLDGYGYSINHKQACPLVRDFMKLFRAAKEEKDELLPKATMYFTHSGTILKFLARLGIFKDPEPLLHNTFHKMENRMWRTSYIDCFASHVVITLFKCKDEFKVAAYVQERLVMLPNCQDELCSFKDIEDYFGPIADSCDLEEMCRLPNN